MKVLSMVAFSASLALAGINSNDLLKEAKDAGLSAMPQGKQLKSLQITKIKDMGVKAEKLLTKDQIELGKMLYFDPRISSSNLISCNTCHNLALGGADLVPTAIGHRWRANPSALNSPTTYNSLFNDVQFWDGRAHNLGEQAQGPIQSDVEMSAPPALVVEKITSIPGYVDAFKKAYGKDVKIDFKLITDTIAIFESTLNTPSRYDEFMNGNLKALNAKEQEGLKLFLDKGCVSCHSGVNLGGGMQPFGVAQPYKFANIGGFKGDKDGLVKVPTLRNIAETMPYFHNGQFWDLKDAIKEMGSIQLGIDISDEEAEKIQTFLQSLTGTKPQIVYPILPVNSDKTPKPTF
ncbi:cytochrome-c peroxidase [Helicobacter cholecystus]|uniref:cytochrome-c peroxidase n=1 Tax=Helicobacter cholecystus TaxID=45498 RepID=UPI002738AD4B|nr:cytochrome-c peroxidase [Helicobacter cholecystus]